MFQRFLDDLARRPKPFMRGRADGFSSRPLRGYLWLTPPTTGATHSDEPDFWTPERKAKLRVYLKEELGDAVSIGD